nr:hypothetical protein [Tanacetum cinerariifolium]
MKEWIEADMPMLGQLCEEQMVASVIDMKGDLAMLFGDDDSSDDRLDDKEDDEEVWEVNEEWLMALDKPPPMQVMPPSSTYKVGGPSTAAAEGHSLAFLAPRVPMPPLVIKDLCTRIGNLEYGRRLLVKKVITDRDLQIQQLQTLVSEMRSREGTLMQCILRMDRRLTDLERRPPGPHLSDIYVGSSSRHLEIIMIGCTGLGTKDCNSWGILVVCVSPPLLLLWLWKIMVILGYEFYVIVDVVSLE